MEQKPSEKQIDEIIDAHDGWPKKLETYRAPIPQF